MNTSADLLKELRIDRKAPPPEPTSRRGLWITLGVIESVGPALFAIDFLLKDVIAFLSLIIVLIIRPSGILGEKLTEEKL